MSVFGPESRAVLVGSMLLCLGVVPGCRWQVGKAPLPFPTPTPSPTPTPTPVSIATAANEEVASAQSSAADRVATASAEYFSELTSEAAASASAVRDALADAQQSDSEALADILPRAKRYLSAARDAQLKSEAAVFFVDPDSAEQLRSQPDPFGVGTLTGDKSALDDLQTALVRLEALLDGSLNADKAADLIIEAKSISVLLEKTQAGLGEMAEAWRPGDADNFRSKYFLASSEGAIARLFQGLLAVSGDLLPMAVAQEESRDDADIVSLVSAVRELYLGGDESRPALHALVQEASPIQGALTRASVARAAALASVLDVAPDNESAKTMLRPALQDLTRQLAFAANSLGIVIVSEE